MTLRLIDDEEFIENLSDMKNMSKVNLNLLKILTFRSFRACSLTN